MSFASGFARRVVVVKPRFVNLDIDGMLCLVEMPVEHLDEIC